jgi:hypothetical protein
MVVEDAGLAELLADPSMASTTSVAFIPESACPGIVHNNA